MARALLSELQLRIDDCPQLIPIFLSAINNIPSPLRKNVAPITCFTSRHSSTHISTVLKTCDFKPLTITDAQQGKAMNVRDLIMSMYQLHQIVQPQVHQEQSLVLGTKCKRQPPNFHEGDYVLMARDQFFEREQLCLRSGGPRRVIKAFNDFLFKAKTCAMVVQRKYTHRS